MDRDEAESPEGRYTNVFQIGHNAFEFVLDFGQVQFPATTVRYHTRIITGPAYAKALLELIRQSIEEYEGEFSAISGNEK